MLRLVYAICFSFLAQSLAFGANGDCTSGGVTITNGSKGCVESFQVSCSGGTLSFDSDSQGNAIPCGGLMNKPVKAKLLESKLKR